MLLLGIFRLIMAPALLATGEAELSSATVFLTNGIAIVAITLAAYKKAEKWAWWSLMLIGLLPLLECTIEHGLMPILLVGWVFFLVGLIAPVQVIFGKKIA